MLVSAVSRLILLWGMIAVGCGLIVYLFLRPLGQTGLTKWAPRFACPVALSLAIWIGLHGQPVVRVVDGPNGPEAARLVDLVTPRYTFAPGEKPMDDMMLIGDDPTWVVNESSHVVKVVSVVYGGYGMDPESTTLLPPGTAKQVYSVDHIGPGDHPPTSVMVDKRIGMDSRNWVTW